MTSEILLRYVHFISIFTIVGTIATEHLLLKNELSRRELGRLARIDAAYGLAALTLLGAGLTLWLTGAGKPAAFYSKNWVFHTKIAMFLLVGILSIRPTLFFLRERKGNPEEIVSIPRSLFWMIRLELLLLFIIPFLAGLMAKGIGLSE
jgi:putative membrane protein